jgi:hypothetical protein
LNISLYNTHTNSYVYKDHKCNDFFTGVKFFSAPPARITMAAAAEAPLRRRPRRCYASATPSHQRGPSLRSRKYDFRRGIGRPWHYRPPWPRRRRPSPRRGTAAAGIVVLLPGLGQHPLTTVPNGFDRYPGGRRRAADRPLDDNTDTELHVDRSTSQNRTRGIVPGTSSRRRPTKHRGTSIQWRGSEKRRE